MIGKALARLEGDECEVHTTFVIEEAASAYLADLVLDARKDLSRASLVVRNLGTAGLRYGSKWSDRMQPKDLLKERSIRKRQLWNARALVHDLIEANGSITEVWFGGSDVIGVFQQVLKNARFTYFHHGLSDLLVAGNHVQPSRAVTSRIWLERKILGASYYVRPADSTVSLVNSETSKPLCDSLMTHYWRESAQDRFWSAHEEGNNGRVLLLLPYFEPTTQRDQMGKILDHLEFAIKIVESKREPRQSHLAEVVLKWHPYLAEYDLTGWIQQFVELASLRIPKNVRFTVVDPLMPAEIILGLGIDVLTGPLSTAHFSARRWYPNVKTLEVPWATEYHVAWQAALEGNHGLASDAFQKREWWKKMNDPLISEWNLANLAREQELLEAQIPKLHAKFPEFAWDRSLL